MSRVLRMHHWLQQRDHTMTDGHLLDGVSWGCLARVNALDGLVHWGHLMKGQADNVRASKGPPAPKVLPRRWRRQNMHFLNPTTTLLPQRLTASPNP